MSNGGEKKTKTNDRINREEWDFPTTDLIRKLKRFVASETDDYGKYQDRMTVSLSLRSFVPKLVRFVNCVHFKKGPPPICLAIQFFHPFINPFIQPSSHQLRKLNKKKSCKECKHFIYTYFYMKIVLSLGKDNICKMCYIFCELYVIGPVRVG